MEREALRPRPESTCGETSAALADLYNLPSVPSTDPGELPNPSSDRRRSSLRHVVGIVLKKALKLKRVEGTTLRAQAGVRALGTRDRAESHSTPTSSTI